jgi:putative oxidoreductase
MALKSKEIISWILAGILALVYIGAGGSKLMGAEAQIRNLHSWGYPLWTLYPIGLIEIGMAIGLLIPRFRKITIYGVFIWTLAAVTTHLQAGQAGFIGAPILLGALAAAILLLSGENRKVPEYVSQDRS